MALLMVPLVLAQEGGEVPSLNAQIFHGSVDGRVGFGLDDASVAADRSVTARASLQYVNRPLVYTFEDGETLALVSDLLGVDVYAASTWKRVRLGLDLPLYLVTAGEGLDGGVALGDLALDGKFTVLDPNDVPFGLAVASRLGMPTASSAAPVGADGVSYEISLVGSQTFGKWQVAANVGQRGVPEVELENVEWGSQFVFRAGVGRSFTDAAGASLELSGASVWGEALSNVASSPIEGMLGGWYRVGPNAVARLGAGTGLTGGIGAPAARIIASIAMEPAEVRDADADGIVDDDDACRDVPEDADAFEDTDGCPELDNDKDGLVDTSDRCPIEPEDKDEWQDDDGCPEMLTEIRVRIVDPSGAAVPGVAVRLGDHRGGDAFTVQFASGNFDFEARASGWDPLTEQISVRNGPPIDVVRVMKPEIRGGTLELHVTRADGRPIDGSWRADGGQAAKLAGGAATAKLLPGTHSIDVTADGFASVTQPVVITLGQTTLLTVVLQPAKVVLTTAKLEILDKIYFDTGKTTIKKLSYPLLAEIARVIQDHPELRRIRIEGHTDSRGSDSSNLKLSDGRAKAVQAWLVKAGIDPARLAAQGFGETRPVDPVENEAAWEKNRRVEFVIENGG